MSRNGGSASERRVSTAEEHTIADIFTSELAFEDALVRVLERDYGWRNGILVHSGEQDLLDNWAQILFENNRGID